MNASLIVIMTEKRKHEPGGREAFMVSGKLYMRDEKTKIFITSVYMTNRSHFCS